MMNYPAKSGKELVRKTKVGYIWSRQAEDGHESCRSGLSDNNHVYNLKDMKLRSIPGFIRWSAMALAALIFCGQISAQVKVACVGNSITFGACVVNRVQNSYPAQLQANLGDGLYSGDSVHFTPEGYRVAAEHILRLLRSGE